VSALRNYSVVSLPDYRGSGFGPVARPGVPTVTTEPR